MHRPFSSQLRPFIRQKWRVRLYPSTLSSPIPEYPAALVAGLRQRYRAFSINSTLPKQRFGSSFVEERIERLGGLEKLPEYFPRLPVESDVRVVDIRTVLQEGANLENGDTRANELVQIHGRITSIRESGRSLAFLDIHDGTLDMTHPVALEKDARAANSQKFSTCQIVLMPSRNETEDAFDLRRFIQNVRRGDWINIRGYTHRTKRGQISILASEMPKLIAPSLQPIPIDVEDTEFLVRNRHVHQIIHPFPLHVLKTRSTILQAMRTFFFDDGFVEVSTPLVVANAGGAVARPFETIATEFSELKLNLRVAPELFLKRLIVGNAAKVFEIGPAFRNEGVDATHNPEFTICEFYERLATLPALMAKTKALFDHISHTLSLSGVPVGHSASTSLDSTASAPVAQNAIQIHPPFKILEFIPEIEKAIQKTLPAWKFPDLRNTVASLKELLSVFSSLRLRAPANPNIPNLLDALCAHFLEPQCYQPTWIMHHPECLSPLAKSFNYTAADGSLHSVAARAELFINHAEFVNCYEEENSPIEQRRKFEQQIALQAQSEVVAGGPKTASENSHETHQTIDESYLEALEWGMPPTGGWGCGVDRLVMFFTGAERIADVLSFGNLRNVVGLGSAMLRRNQVEHGKEREGADSCETSSSER